MTDFTLPDVARGGNEALIRANNPLDDFLDAGKRLGLPVKAIEDLRKRFQAADGTAIDVREKLETSELLKMIDEKIRLTFHYLDDYVLSKANAQSLMTTGGILIDKRQLLSGEPTHILSHADRQNMNDLLPALQAEVERRGLTIEHHTEHDGSIQVQVLKDVTP